MTQGKLSLEVSSLKVLDLELLVPKVPHLSKVPFGLLPCVSLLASSTFWFVLFCLGQLQFSHFFKTFLNLKYGF